MKKLYIFILMFFAAIVTDGQDDWTAKANFGGTSRYGAVSFSIGTKAYIGTGFDGINKNDFWEWDQATNVWTRKADFPGAARYQAVAFSIDGKGYIGTGASGLSFPFTPHYSDFWEYDPGTDHWTEKASFPGTERFGAVGFSVDGKGYIGTGIDAFTYFQKDFWEYDPSTDEWTRKADFAGMERMEAVGFSIGSKGYIGTGGNYMSGILLFNDFWEYSPATNSWLRKADFGGTARSQAVGFSAGGVGYVGVGGDFNSTAYSDFWAYNQPSNTWVEKADFGGIARWLSTGFSIGDKGYIGTGGNFIPTYKDLWEYSPSTTGVNEWSENKVISIYPNPASDIISVQLSQNEKVQVDIYSALGEKVMSRQIENSEAISVSDFSSGMYYVKITSDHGASESKLIIRK